MTIILTNDAFHAIFEDSQYWNITDHISTDHVKKLRNKIPEGHFIAAYVLGDTNSAWKNYANTEVTYLDWEPASEHHAGAEIWYWESDSELQPAWSTLHPVGDIYIVYESMI